MIQLPWMTKQLLPVRDFIGNVAVITTVLQFLSGVLVCREYVNNRSTNEASPLPFILGVISSVTWFLYGTVKSDEKIMLVNTFGIILMASYTIVFYKCTFKKSAVIRPCLAALLYVLLVSTYYFTEEDSFLLADFFGPLASLITLATIASPMVKLLHVIKVKSTECLPFPLILMSFIVSTLWFVYGEIEEDMYLANVNVIAMAIALAQLSLFYIYPRRSTELMKSVIA